MKSSFASRRKARVIGHDDDDEPDTSSALRATTVRRPTLKSKSRPSSRISFANDGAPVIKSTSLRKSILTTILSSDHLPTRDQEDDDSRPSYSQSSLAALRNSTPAAPQYSEEDAIHTSLLDNTENTPPPTNLDLDIASKFGTSLTTSLSKPSTSLIPTEAEIQEKKARRARLAKELKYNAHNRRSSSASSAGSNDSRALARPDSDDDEFRTQTDRITLNSSSNKASKYAETRLVHSDEDMLEDFGSYVEDSSGLTLNKKARREQKKQQREAMRSMIDSAEGVHSSAASNIDDDESDSEKERREEYAATQTRSGMALSGRGGQRGRRDGRERARTPPKITPLPSLKAVGERLRERAGMLEREMKERVVILEGIEREKKEIEEREEEVKRLWEEAARRWEGIVKEQKGENGDVEETGRVGVGGGREIEFGGRRGGIGLLGDSGEGRGQSSGRTPQFGAGLGFGSPMTGIQRDAPTFTASGLGMQNGLDSFGTGGTPLRVENGDET